MAPLTLLPCFRLRSPIQIASVINCDIEKSGRDYTACFKTINDAVMFASYMQAVTPRLALGGELCYAAPRMETSLTLGAKYRTPSWVAAARVDLDGDMQLGYVVGGGGMGVVASDAFLLPSR